MELLVLLLSIINLLLAAAVVLGGRYLLRRLDELEEQVHQLSMRNAGHDAPLPPADASAMGTTAWNE